MTRPRKNKQAGGVILAVAILAGAIGGGLLGQASLGFLIGVGVGLLAVMLVWLVDRR